MPAPQYARIDVATVTPRTAPLHGIITHVERNSRYVLEGEGRLLIGPLGVNYRIEGADSDVVYLCRIDGFQRRVSALDK